MTESAQPGTASEFPRQWVAQDVDFGNWDEIETYYRDLVERKVKTKDQLEAWLCQASELESCLDEERANRYVASTCHTDDDATQRHYLYFVEHIEAKQEPWRNRMLRRFVELADQIPLPPKRYEVLLRSARNTIELFREQNIPLQTEEKRLQTEYQRITGAMTVEYDGREQTLQQMARYLEEPDRSIREETWRLACDRFMQDADRLDDLFVKLVDLRNRIAGNADCRDFREYTWKRYERFDYSPKDCLRFHDAIETAVLPAVRRLADQRRRKLGIDSLRPWDLSVDPDGRPPLRPFENEAEFARKASQVFHEVHPELGRIFDELRRRDLLDLGSRKGKAPGGYQETFHERRVPFIFMNAVGTDYDVRTLLHEGGHAFHTWHCRNEPLLAYRSCESVIEFAEVASMGMECLALPHTGVFFGAETDRASQRFFERIVQFFPFMARIDAFQHGVYTDLAAGPNGWKDHWQRLTQRFSPEIDYRGLESVDRQAWQRKLHIYEVPFYYVEYGIAQLGALQVWQNSRNDYQQAIADYRNGLTLGGSRPLPELFEAAGCRFDFSEATLRPLIDAVVGEIGRRQ